MTIRTSTTSMLLVGIASLALAVESGQAAPRTFVASYGNDANTCALTLPCRSFNAALAQTVAGGEVIVLDSAGYGPMTITQSVSIIAPAGVYAGISVFSGTGVTINGAGAKVVLRNLVMNGLGGVNGIFVPAAAELHLEKCVISNFTNIGVALSAPSKVTVVDSSVRGNNTGVARQSGDFAPSHVNFERVRIFGNSADGLRLISQQLTFDITRSVLSFNAGAALLVGPNADGSLGESLVSDNPYGLLLGGSLLGGLSGSFEAVADTVTRNGVGGAIGPNFPTAIGSVVAARNLVSQNGSDGLTVFGSDTPATLTLVADGNTFSTNGTFAIRQAGIGSTLKSVPGADGLPNNAGEQTTPTSGTITVATPF